MTTITMRESLHTTQFAKEILEGLTATAKHLVLIGLDLKKCPNIILAAYNDQEGITKRFNLNLLERINRELDADFDTRKFEHFPVYDPPSGACKSYLISVADQQVTLCCDGEPQRIRFARHEEIFMEISQKLNHFRNDEQMLRYDCS